MSLFYAVYIFSWHHLIAHINERTNPSYLLFIYLITRSYSAKITRTLIVFVMMPTSPFIHPLLLRPFIPVYYWSSQLRSIVPVYHRCAVVDRRKNHSPLLSAVSPHFFGRFALWFDPLIIVFLASTIFQLSLPLATVLLLSVSFGYAFCIFV